MQILERFDKVRPAGRGTWNCCCPAHDDSSPSLTVTQEAGKWLFHCHAGCSTYDILEAVGLKWGDLFPDTNYNSDTADYARQLWGEASSGCVQFHPYAKKKQITHDFGARRRAWRTYAGIGTRSRAAVPASCPGLVSAYPAGADDRDRAGCL